MSSTIARNGLRASVLRQTQLRAAPIAKRWNSQYVFQEGDTVLLQKRKFNPTDFLAPLHSAPLKAGGNIQTARGRVLHDDIIGQPGRAIVRDVKDRSSHNEYRLIKPTLGEYSNYTKRVVTPLYPHDANLITSLLDINPNPPRPTDDLSTPYEIFEAGTGHGALTLHLARGLQAFNPAPPPAPVVIEPSTIDGQAVASEESLKLDDPTAEEDVKVLEEYDAYKKNRRAVLHTLDIDPKYQRHARKIVRGFRQGMYIHNIDFHVGTIPSYLQSRLGAQPPTSSSDSTPQPFLQHAILDLPASHKMLDIASQCVKTDGLVLVFCPSITQIVSCLKEVKENNLPFVLEETLEIGHLAGTGGKPWKVGAMRARSVERAEKLAQGGLADGSESDVVLDAEVKTGGEEGAAPVKLDEEEGWNFIARPMAPGRISGNSFVGKFRRLDF